MTQIIVPVAREGIGLALLDLCISISLYAPSVYRVRWLVGIEYAGATSSSTFSSTNVFIFLHVLDSWFTTSAYCNIVNTSSNDFLAFGDRTIEKV